MLFSWVAFEEYCKQLIFPQYCELCYKAMIQTSALCRECLSGLPRIKGAQCEVCAIALPMHTISGRCSACVKSSRAFDYVVTNYRFEQQMKELISTLKYKKGTFLARDLGVLLAGALSDERLGAIDSSEWAVTAVPLHFLRYRQRSFNQAALLAREVSGQTGVPYFQSLSRERYTTQQVRLSRKERQRNMRGAFVSNGTPLLRKKVLLVDDVYTSGATVDGCARVLKGLGAETVVVLCLARGI